MQVTLPYNFHPRWYQLLILKAIAKGYKRIIIILPRRAGKDLTVLNAIFNQMVQKIGVYFYFFPEQAQARKVIWDGMTNDGFRFMQHMPAQYVKRKREDTMMLELKGNPGSILQMMAANQPDRVVGSNPILCAFSEYPLMNPAIWDYVQPILVQNGGTALFMYTPRGDDHGLSLYNYGLEHPDEWYVLRLTSDDTRHLGKTYPEHLANLEIAKRDYMARHGDLALFEQEFMCSFEAPLIGAYYADVMRTLAVDNRITDVPWDPALPVYTTWDLGINDECVIWFVQITPQGLWRWIDVIYGANRNAEYFAGEILARQIKGWRFMAHYLPHDGDYREKGSGLTYKEQLQPFLPHHEIIIVERIKNKYNRITQTRLVLPKSVFDKNKCERGISALKTYRRDFHEELLTYKNEPVHDWSSHYADALGQIIQYWKPDEERAADVYTSPVILNPYQ